MTQCNSPADQGGNPTGLSRLCRKQKNVVKYPREGHSLPGQLERLPMNDSFLYPYCDMLLESSMALPELGVISRADRKTPRRTVPISFATGNAVEHAGICWYDDPQGSVGTGGLVYGRLGDSYLLRCRGLADFVIDMQRWQVTCHITDGVAHDTLRHLLLDQVLPRMIGQSGRLSLHASAVADEAGVIVFVGRSGWGKSTLAASFEPRGQFFADDFVLLDMPDDGASRVVASSNYRGARLWPDSISALFPTEPETAGIAHYSPKRRLPGVGGASPAMSGAPLRAIFLLNDPMKEPAPATAIVPFGGKDALMLLVRRAFLLDSRDMDLVTRLWLRAGDMLRSGLPVAQLSYPRTHGELAKVRRAVRDFLHP